MIKLGQLETWEHLAPQEKRTLHGRPNRLVRLEVNSPGTATLWLIDDDGVITFIAAVTHCDVVEFTTERGDITLWTPDKDVYLYTAEMETSHVVIEDPEIFTGLMERSARNPDLEWMEFQARVNMQRLLDQQRNEFDQQLKEMQEAARNELDAGGESDAGAASAEPKSHGSKQALAAGGAADEAGVVSN